MSDQHKTTNNTSRTGDLVTSPVISQTKPNDRAGLMFSGLVKIFDPNTKKVFVETRS